MTSQEENENVTIQLRVRQRGVAVLIFGNTCFNEGSQQISLHARSFSRGVRIQQATLGSLRHFGNVRFELLKAEVDLLELLNGENLEQSVVCEGR